MLVKKYEKNILTATNRYNIQHKTYYDALIF